MNNDILFSLPGNDQLATSLAKKLGLEIGKMAVHDFPDGESYVRFDSDVKNKTVILVARLDHPNNKILPLMFTANTLRELGAKRICLITPYLPYMRQDKRFKPGEAVSSFLFAKLISDWVDDLITIDPHLHRIKDLSTIFSLDAVSVLHATTSIADWIANHINSPFIIGPDEESEQWVSEVAKLVSAPYAIVKKIRYSDRSVSVSVPDIGNIHQTPVLLDDIISTGTSMLAVIHELLSKGLQAPICICVHALFDDMIAKNLLNAGAKKIITCNTIPNDFSQIDLSDLIASEILRLKF